MLRIQALHKDFLLRKGMFGWLQPSRRTVLSGLDLDVGQGEIVALRGDNGSGKTTLLKVIAGLLSPTSGEVSIAGSQEMVGVTFADSRSFYWRLSCRENLRFFGALDRLTGRRLDARIEVVAGQLGLSPLLDDPFMTLSSGQMQRLAIVRTLLKEPTLWLLDEATRSLDAAGRDAVHAALAALRQRGGSALWVSHDDRETGALCNRAVRLDRGRLAGEAA